MNKFFFSSRRRHTRCALVTGVQTCALPISIPLRRAGFGAVQRFDQAEYAVLRAGGERRRIARDLAVDRRRPLHGPRRNRARPRNRRTRRADFGRPARLPDDRARSEEPTSELQSLMRISYAVFCLNKINQTSK